MYVVELTSAGNKVSTRTSFPENIVENTLAAWASKGFWVQKPLPECGSAVYTAYRGGKEVYRMKVREIPNED